VGSETWFSLAHAFCQFSAGFTKLINRPLAAIDFGGGWSPHFFIGEEGSNNEKLNILLQSLYVNFCSVQSELPSVQFELGKSISEGKSTFFVFFFIVEGISLNYSLRIFPSVSFLSFL
jgi:hypothetical protein